MKICIITSFYPPLSKNGVATSVYRIAKNLHLSGHDVYVFAPSNTKDTNNFSCQTENGVKVYRTNQSLILNLGDPFEQSTLLYSIYCLVKAIHEKVKFDLIHADPILLPGFFATQLGEELNIPIIIRGQGIDVEAYRLNPILYPSLQSAIQKSTAITVCNEEMAKYINTLIKGNKIPYVVPNAIDTEMFSKKNISELTHKYNLKTKFVNQVINFHKSTGHFVIGTSGLIRYRKGFDLMLQAFKIFLKQYPKSIFLIIGDFYSKEKKYNLSQIKKNGLLKKVFYTGMIPTEDVMAWLKQLDLFLFTSRVEGSPCAVLEAMHAKLPIITSNISGIRELIQDNQTGFLIDNIEKEPIDKIVEKIIWVRENYSQVTSFGEKAKNTVETCFSAKTETENWQKIYNDVINKYTK